MAFGRCTRKLSDGSDCGRTTLDTRGSYLALDGTSRWVLLCKRHRRELDRVLAPFVVNAASASWLTAAPITAPDETVWPISEVRQALSMFLGEAGRAKAGALSRWDLELFFGLFRGVAADIDSHAEPDVIELLREQMEKNRAK